MAKLFNYTLIFSLLTLLSYAQNDTVSWSTLPPSAKFLDAKTSSNFWKSCFRYQIDVSPQENGYFKEADRVKRLPGQPLGVDFDQYAGYVTVDSETGRALFYYFVESPSYASEKPLVLWLNGGPGCSSIGYGAFEELGPFRVNKDGKTLYRNNYAWNREANIIFLESPAGVGFSYSNTTLDYDSSGDNRTAHDTYTFLINWLERFPEYKSRDLYITGESYGGHYVPQLARLILRNNQCHNHTKINLRGVAIGNAYIDFETAALGIVDYLWTHALISDEVHDGIQSNCNFSSPATISKTCQNYVVRASIAVGNINTEDIYAPMCNSSSGPVTDRRFDPCSDKYVASYLNMPNVQAALHANITRLSYPWQNCSKVIQAKWKDSAISVLPVIQELLDYGLRVWLYSGDTDGVIPTTSTRYALNRMNLSIKTPWYPWYTGGEVGGYVVGYGNLTFVTVRGAGHTVPSYQPARALVVFSSFLAGKLPPPN